ncbi:NAD(P)/FAD-dependent oxidoreductase [Vreelandella malpeensis]|uniref:NAD(P)/FAD-dependent oxidoreductase n=1 Tax=Vreelandella malpeensis TaxID=1172368 RepID=A0ABS8DQR9_9GAMM|nr:NAD(P)/FAD-dependent oxidoreductase [Halomonas malpeensis]MCB8888616.1 NAD(P)/FAD-dependent oxidoreductase [Halomonas malpeensis]
MVFDVVIIGAGAAGLMCAAQAGYAGKRVLVLDHANKAGKKILMSGGGRCNFTNLDTAPHHFYSQNQHFCISALKRYRPEHFVELVERHGLAYVEKAPGQLFCADSAKKMVKLLLTECEWAGAEVSLETTITRVERAGRAMRLETSLGRIDAGALVVATGGLSIPTLGASGFGYEIARQFGLEVLPTRPGLVPLTLSDGWKARASALSGVSVPVSVEHGGQGFAEPMLFTHRGLSGPAMLQISSVWEPGETLTIDLLPKRSARELLFEARAQAPRRLLSTWLGEQFPKRLAQALIEWYPEAQTQVPLAQFSNEALEQWAERLNAWTLKPSGTEGWRTAEVTMGGIDTDAISSKTFEVKGMPQLRFIGEVLDVTGRLGGYNFQWAWSSAVACAQAL